MRLDSLDPRGSSRQSGAQPDDPRLALAAGDLRRAARPPERRGRQVGHLRHSLHVQDRRRPDPQGESGPARGQGDRRLQFHGKERRGRPGAAVLVAGAASHAARPAHGLRQFLAGPGRRLSAGAVSSHLHRRGHRRGRIEGRDRLHRGQGRGAPRPGQAGAAGRHQLPLPLHRPERLLPAHLGLPGFRSAVLGAELWQRQFLQGQDRDGGAERQFSSGRAHDALHPAPARSRQRPGSAEPQHGRRGDSPAGAQRAAPPGIPLLLRREPVLDDPAGHRQRRCRVGAAGHRLPRGDLLRAGAGLLRDLLRAGLLDVLAGLHPRRRRAAGHVFSPATLVGLSTQYILEQIERARTRRTLEQYVSRDVAGQLLDNPAQYNASLVAAGARSRCSSATCAASPR